MTDDQRTVLVDALLDSLAALEGNTLPADDLRAIAAHLEDHANDLEEDEAMKLCGDSSNWDAADAGDEAFDFQREQERFEQ